ncbi:MAG: 50S ribosomal protein L29 [Candidatus Delongbacteria bacterium]|jgi:large subunit ribosomal protein L29|nr:50S ribosomal protein L29 [Candidatus Delongbacteria bacterium]
MKNSEIKQLTTKEILEKIGDEKNTLNRLKMSHAVSPLENPNKITDVKRDIARLKTELRSRELSEN